MIEIDPRWAIALVAHFYRVELKMELIAIFEYFFREMLFHKFFLFVLFLRIFSAQCTTILSITMLRCYSWSVGSLIILTLSLKYVQVFPPKIGSITTAATAHFSFFCNHRQLQYTFLLIYGTQSLILIDCSFTWVYFQ